MPVSPNMWKEVVDLREKRKASAEKAIELAGKAREEKREFTGEEKGSFDGLVKEVNELGETIETREKLWNAIRTDDEWVLKVPPHLRNQYKETGATNPAELRHVDGVVKYMHGDKNVLGNPEYRDIQLTTPSSGGFLILPEQMSSRLLKKVDDMLWISKFSTNIPLTDTKTLGIPTIETEMDDLSWTTEIATIPEASGPTFGKRALVLNPFRTMIKVSDVWLQTITSKQFFSSDDKNGVNVTPLSLIEDRIAYHIARTKENNFFNGNGVGKPLGLFTDSTRGISGGTDIGAGITYNGLVNAKYGLKVQYHNEGVWILHRSMMAVIMKLADQNNRPLLNFMTFPEQPATLLGNKVMLSEFCPSTVTAGSYIGLFGSLRYYWTIFNPRVNVRIVDQLFAQTAQTAFFALAEADGMPVLNEAFTRLLVS